MRGSDGIDDGQGGVNVVVTADATVDCTAPNCWNVQTINIEPHSATVTFDADEIVRGIVARKKFVYLCTNGLLLEQKLALFTPSKYLNLSVHLDGLEPEHDSSVCRDGVYRRAHGAIRAALARGFRVTTNTTLFEGADPERTATFFDEMMRLGVEGMTISPGYRYERAAGRERCLVRERTHQLFRRILGEPERRRHWRFNQSPLFLEFLVGARDYDCTPWGNPTFNIN